MSEVIVAALGILGVVLTYIFKKPEQRKETVDTTITNLRMDLDESRKRAKDLIDRVESLEDRERRRFRYELRHSQWDEEMVSLVRRLAPGLSIPEPPPFTYFIDPQFSMTELQEIKDSPDEPAPGN